LAALPEGIVVEDLSAGLDDGPDAFIDTAAVMAHLDLVVTSDTAIAHLAGALGRPAWVALKHVPDWRWLLDREDSPWYPTLRLFRQPAPGAWDQVFERIAGELRERASACRPAPHLNG
jgi:ADP-heptose:LPS heptosyltransferase